MSGKRYHAKDPRTIDAHPFELAVWRGTTEEVHEFNAKPQADLGPMVAMYRNADDPIKMGESAIRLMLKQMDDTDGVSVSWAPTVLPRPRNAKADWAPKFRGPDGKLYPMDKQDQFLDLTVGSSRRRWQHILVEDDGVSIDADVLMEIMGDLIGAAMGERPTPA